MEAEGSSLVVYGRYGFFFRNEHFPIHPELEAVVAGVPHWFVGIGMIGVAAAPWFRWRFTLRTLLIATTLVAVALGLIVYVVRQ